MVEAAIHLVKDLLPPDAPGFENYVSGSFREHYTHTLQRSSPVIVLPNIMRRLSNAQLVCLVTTILTR